MIWETNADNIYNQPPPEYPYFRKAFDFLMLWQAGQDKFALQTSGSTGHPKLISVTRNQLRASAEMTGQALSLYHGTRALVCLNVDYVAGLMMLVRGMELKWELTVVEPSSNPLAGLDAAFDFIAMVPAQLAGCLAHTETRVKLNSVGKILLGGAPVSRELEKQINALTVPVYQSYGMTETVSHVAIRRLNGPDAREYYTILPGIFSGVDARGCLWVSGAVSSHETVQTNDLVELLGGNCFRWLGREDHVVNSGGVKIVLDQIDAVVADVLLGHELSASFFSWYEPDEILGQKLILIFESGGDHIDTNELLAEIRKRVSAYQTPKHVYFASQFVKTPSDKVNKRLTADLLFKNTNG
jgi:O-succinylbenzoic acid--CoA ligase